MLSYSFMAYESYTHERFERDPELATHEAWEAAYQDRCSQFRAALYTKLFADGALSEGQGWAVYDLNEGEHGAVAMADGQNDALVLLNGSPCGKIIDGHILADIHIITNEIIADLNGQHRILTTDFTLDGDNDAQYLVDGVFADSNTLSTKYGALFIVEDGQLRIINRPLPYFTIPPPLQAEGQELYPLGHFNSLYDKIDALDHAVGVMSTLQHLKPTNVAA